MRGFKDKVFQRSACKNIIMVLYFVYYEFIFFLSLFSLTRLGTWSAVAVCAIVRYPCTEYVQIASVPRHGSGR